MIDQIVHITDLHLANNPPENRKDDYNQSIIDKFSWVLNYCERNGVSNVALTGDLSHSYKPNDELMYSFAKCAKKMKKTIFFIYGNHDIQGSNRDHVEKTNFGLLELYPWFRPVANKPAILNNCVIYGYDYGMVPECSNAWLIPTFENIDDKNKFKILMIHPMIVNEPTLFLDGVFKKVNWRDIQTNADVLLCGHYHDGFPEIIKTDVLEKQFYMVNPGALARVNVQQAKEGHGPRLAHLKISKHKINIELVDIPHKPIEEVFRLDVIEEKKAKKLSDSQFVEALTQLSQSNVMEGNFLATLEEILENPPEGLKEVVDENVIKLCREKVKECC